MLSHNSRLKNYRTKRVVVTGGAGFIGSHLVRRLCSLGAQVLVIDDLSSGSRSRLVGSIEFVELDIRNKSKLSEVIGRYDPEVLFHLAAYSRTQGSEEEKDRVYTTNIIGTANVCEASIGTNCKMLVYSASSTCYGSRTPPQSINTLPDFGTHYAISKYAGEEVVKLWSLTNRRAAVSLRYFSVFGDGQPETGQYALVLGIFLDRARQNLPLIVHGDGKQRRDFVHVDDVVTANLLAGLSLELDFKALNVGTGTSHSIIEIANMISKNICFAPPRVGDSKETLADLSECQKILGWCPSDCLSKYIQNIVRL